MPVFILQTLFNFYNELRSMTGQCLKDRKMTNIDMLREETSAWATNSNEKQRGVNWQFKVENARQNYAHFTQRI